MEPSEEAWTTPTLQSARGYQIYGLVARRVARIRTAVGGALAGRLARSVVDRDGRGRERGRQPEAVLAVARFARGRAVVALRDDFVGAVARAAHAAVLLGAARQKDAQRLRQDGERDLVRVFEGDRTAERTSRVPLAARRRVRDAAGRVERLQ